RAGNGEGAHYRPSKRHVNDILQFCFTPIQKGLAHSNDRHWCSTQLAILASAAIVSTEARFLLIELCLA
ncbi:hypothetical protein, partial [Stutzerimonas nitrititolerans]|uniref:hypothetical protein n=1 Tax=Stutzerimonas nitrititolerans TaxID=2482751 RepID=UPI0028A962A4